MREEGIIKSKNKNELIITILKDNNHSCEHCKLKASCCIFGNNNNKRELKIQNNNQNDFNIGDLVNIEISERMGSLYSILIFLIPLVLFLIPLIALQNIFNQGINLLFGIGLIIIYFFILKKLQFQINKNIKIFKKYGGNK